MIVAIATAQAVVAVAAVQRVVAAIAADGVVERGTEQFVAAVVIIDRDRVGRRQRALENVVVGQRLVVDTVEHQDRAGRSGGVEVEQEHGVAGPVGPEREIAEGERVGADRQAMGIAGVGQVGPGVGEALAEDCQDRCEIDLVAARAGLEVGDVVGIRNDCGVAAILDGVEDVGVLARAAGQQVAAIVPVGDVGEDVVAVAAEDRVVAGRAVVAALVRIRAARRVDAVVARAGVDALVAAGAGNDGVIAGIAGHGLVRKAAGGERVVTVAARGMAVVGVGGEDQVVVAEAAGEARIAAVGDQRVVAGAAVHRLVVGVAGTDDRIIAEAAEQRGRLAGDRKAVVAVAAVDRVGAVAVADGVIALTGRDAVVAAAVRDRIVAGRADDRVVAAAAIEDRAGGAEAGIDGIVTVATVQRILAGTTDQRVVTGLADDRVVSRSADKAVVAAAAVNGIVAAIAENGVVELRADQNVAVVVVIDRHGDGWRQDTLDDVVVRQRGGINAGQHQDRLCRAAGIEVELDERVAGAIRCQREIAVQERIRTDRQAVGVAGVGQVGPGVGEALAEDRQDRCEIDLVAARAGLEVGDVVGIRNDCGVAAILDGVEDVGVLARAAGQQVAAIVPVGDVGEDVVAVAAEDRVVAGRAVVAALVRIRAVGRVDRVVAGAGVDAVVAALARGDRIIAGVAGDRLVAVAGDGHRVVAGAAGDGIVMPGQRDAVFAGTGVDRLVVDGNIDGVVESAADDPADVGQRIEAAAGIGAAARGVGRGAAVERDGDAGALATVVDGVDPRAAIQRVGTCAADERVVTDAAEQGIVAVAAVEAVRAGQANQAVVAGIAEQRVVVQAAGQGIVARCADLAGAGAGGVIADNVITGDRRGQDALQDQNGAPAAIRMRRNLQRGVAGAVGLQPQIAIGEGIVAGDEVGAGRAVVRRIGHEDRDIGIDIEPVAAGAALEIGDGIGPRRHGELAAILDAGDVVGVLPGAAGEHMVAARRSVTVPIGHVLEHVIEARANDGRVAGRLVGCAAAVEDRVGTTVGIEGDGDRAGIAAVVDGVAGHTDDRVSAGAGEDQGVTG